MLQTPKGKVMGKVELLGECRSSSPKEKRMTPSIMSVYSLLNLKRDRAT